MRLPILCLVVGLALLPGCAPARPDSVMPGESAIFAHLPPGVPAEVLARLTVVPVRYYGPDGTLRQGQIVVDRAVARDIRRVFAVIRLTRFPVTSVLPVSHPLIQARGPYGLSPDTDNSSGFVWRPAAGMHRLSLHALGLAVDINPRRNPCGTGNRALPPGAVRDPAVPGSLLPDSPVVRAFKRLGWQWGGDWSGRKDYMHFQKIPPRLRTWVADCRARFGRPPAARPGGA